MHEAANTYIYTIICYAETMTSITQPDVQSIGIQCNLLAAPPLRKIQYKEEESLPTCVLTCTLLHRELRDYSLGQIAFAVFLLSNSCFAM